MQPTGYLYDSADRWRRRYDWLRMVLPGALLFRTPIWWPSGGGGTRKAGRTVAVSLVALHWVGTHQIRLSRREARSPTSQASAEPLCEGQQGAANGQDSWGAFQGCTGLWKAGCWLAPRLHQLKASNTMDLSISFFVISV